MESDKVEADSESHAAIIASETQRLREHLGLDRKMEGPPSTIPRVEPVIFVEKAPYAIIGAKCRLPTCQEAIACHQYRVAMFPGMIKVSDSYKPKHTFPSCYHINCFELIADFTRAEYLNYVYPMTSSNFKQRGASTTPVAHMQYVLDGGAYRLVTKWKSQVGSMIDRRDSITREKDPCDPDIEILLEKAGSHTVTIKKPQQLSALAFKRFFNDLAPIESDGPDDANEWNLFQEYMPRGDDEQILSDRHSLSRMLADWKLDCYLVHQPDERLTLGESTAKKMLTDKAKRAISRLGCVFS